MIIKVLVYLRRKTRFPRTISGYIMFIVHTDGIITAGFILKIRLSPIDPKNSDETPVSATGCRC